ncbi:MAG: MFS transporter, partial [Eubacteriales bacterium]|nr:MFS transporter [Eubacteriales bacterium]
MNHLTGTKHRQALMLYLVILAMAALGAGLSDNILSNYFKDAYQVTAFQRGLIEIPREAPGVIGVFIVTALVALGDIRIAAIAQALMIVGLLFLGFLTPPYAIMLVFIFIHSLGGHIWYPLQDSIGMQLIRDDRQAGKTVGNYKAISTAFGM